MQTDKDLIPPASTGELKLQFFKMMGDCHGNLVEYAISDAKSKAAESTNFEKSGSAAWVRKWGKTAAALKAARRCLRKHTKK